MSNFLANLFQSAAKALGAVESIDAVAEQEMTNVALGTEQYEAGAAVVLGTISVESHAGTIVDVMDGGTASKALGLS